MSTKQATKLKGLGEGYQVVYVTNSMSHIASATRMVTYI